MSNTLIIYDDNGKIFFQASGSVETPVGLQHLFVEVPIGSYVTSIDTSVIPHVAVIETPPRPILEIEIETLKEDNITTLTALAEVYEMILALQS